ncbi:MAG: enoyl-CoA hydratase-related protein [Pseudomonadota bacterium]
MDYEAIKYEVNGPLATIAMNRPDVKNALNTRMRVELQHAVKAAEREARALVITGIGDAFCSGQDLSDRGTAASLDIERTLRDEYEPLLLAIYDCAIPTISAVNGPAAGAGANLALAADIVFAKKSAVFLQAFTRIGLMPDAGGTYWLPKQMGFAKAMGAALFAEPITADQASEWGMIWAAVPDAEFQDTVFARATQLANGPTQAFQRTKQALRESYDNTLDKQLALEAHLQGECGRTRDFTEGVMAFLEKRPAAYEGR